MILQLKKNATSSMATAAALFFTVPASFAEEAQGVVEIDPGVEVVVAPQAPKTTLFAADEMTNFLSRVLGCEVPLVSALTADKTCIVLGTNSWSRAAGIDVSSLKRDGFVIKADSATKRIYIAGGDDPKFDLRMQVAKCPPDDWSRVIGEHATLYGAYDFLERYAGVRFYFPGEMGTIVPSRRKLTVAGGCIRSEPDWSVRVIFPYEFGEWCYDHTGTDRTRDCQLEQYRLRTQTESIPCCHGQYFMNLAHRFGQTHPEYFCLTDKGVRMTNESGKASFTDAQHLCQSSAIWDEIYQDAKSYFSGEPAGRRGALSGFDDKVKIAWGQYAAYGKFYDVSPHDVMPLCRCAACQAAYASASNREGCSSELIWGQTARLANRLKADGLSGWVSQMAYGSFRTIPQVEIPDNVVVTVCETGPWSFSDPTALEKEYAEIRAWSKKCNGKLWLWTYPGKFRYFALDIPDVPMCATKTWIKYMKAVAPHVLGVFPELGSERFIYHHLDLYLYSRIAWDHDCDARAILDEYYRLMYGAGASAMEEFFDRFENIWMTRIVGKSTPVPWGFSFTPPDPHRMMTEIYPPSEIASFESIVARALAAVKDDSPEAARIRFMSEKFLGPLATRSRGYRKSIDPKTELAWRAAHPGTNLVANGSFDSFENWGRNFGDFEIDTNVCFSAPSSLRISTRESRTCMDGGPYARALAYQRLKLKPNTRYRVSCMVKLEGMKTVQPEGGFNLLPSGPASFGRKLLSVAGTHDWLPYVIEIKTSAEMKPGDEVLICPRISVAYGTAWIDDLRVDELQ